MVARGHTAGAGNEALVGFASRQVSLRDEAKALLAVRRHRLGRQRSVQGLRHRAAGEHVRGNLLAQ